LTVFRPSDPRGFDRGDCRRHTRWVWRWKSRVRIFGKWKMVCAGKYQPCWIDDLTDIEIDTENCDSVAGLVMTCLDRVPVPGDAFCLIEPKVCLTVQEVTGLELTRC